MIDHFFDVEKFEFNDKIIRGFVMTNIDDMSCQISDICVKFQKNRAIVFDLITDNKEIIKYLRGNNPKYIRGNYYHSSFLATINNIKNHSSHAPFYQFTVVVDLIEFSQHNIFFINSSKKYTLEIIPTQNMIQYMKRKSITDLFYFDSMSYAEYDKKYRYLMELNSLIYEVPILIEKVELKDDTHQSLLFQSQYIDEKFQKHLTEVYQLIKNNFFTSHLEIYLNNYISFKTSQKMLDVLLRTYLITDLYNGKEEYNLNDISGFIDLFDAIFSNLGGEKEVIKKKCKKCQNEIAYEKKYELKDKIDFILDKLEPELKKNEIDPQAKTTEILSKFRNRMRHPDKDFIKYDLEKISTFVLGVLKLYSIKHILEMKEDDYDINKILLDFKIYPLIEHSYTYNNQTIIIYNTKLDNYGYKTFSENTVSFVTLKEHKNFKEAMPEDFVYQSSKELKKIYISDDDKIKRALIFWGVIVSNKEILKSEKDIYPFDENFEEFMNILEVEQ